MLGELPYWQSVALGARYDELYAELKSLLQSHCLTGYHCTRQTAFEINEVRTHGLLPSSPELLSQRIRRLNIPFSIQERLCNENDASEENRKGMIWFCLFPPVQQAVGVQRFFRSWGGEALYNSHESDPEIGPRLRQIGIPCVVEMKIPIHTMQHQFFVSAILKHHFGIEEGPIMQEDFSAKPLAASDIVMIHQYPTASFIRLTGWNDSDE